MAIKISIVTRIVGTCVSVEGHASTGDEKNDVRICAAVSALTMTLAAFAQQVPHAGGDGTGKMLLHLGYSPKTAEYLVFYRRGLSLIDEAYPGALEFEGGNPNGNANNTPGG